MVNLIFRDGNRHVDPVWDTRPALIDSFRSIMESKVSRLSCPSHKSRCKATLLIDVRSGSTSWDIADFCCEHFRRTIKDNMPYPYKNSAVSGELGRAA